jgi:hypothetical protein
MKLKFFSFSAAGMTIDILVFTFAGKFELGDEYASTFYESPKAKEALAEVIPWLDAQSAFELP